MALKPGDTIAHDPDATLVYEMDWSDWLDASAEISTSTWAIAPDDGTLVDDEDSIVTGNQKTRVRLSGGTAGTVYTITNHIETNETPAQADDRSFRLRVRER